jgi:TonB-linked SusC/RagA family outer membrane protein
MMILPHRLLSLSLAFLLAGVTGAAAQQAQTVTGRVVDAATLSPLAGVAVSLEGSNVGAVTTADGRYTIQAPGTGALLFSTLGYSEQRVPIQNRTVVNVTLSAAALMLEELVAVGYSQQSRATVSAAVSQVTAEDLESQAAFSTTAGALAGMVQGISVRTAINSGSGLSGSSNGIPGEAVDGRPGAVAEISIRNMGDPLYVIDGIPSDAGSFNHINSSDIESISILKDAAAAVYGFRAANGVILVTTKKGGREQAPRISVNGAYGIQNLTRFHYMRMFDAYQFMYNRADSNTSIGNIVAPAARDAARETLEKYRQGAPGFESTDYYDLGMNNPNAPQYNLNANISGGSENAQYYLSGGHQQQDYNVSGFTWGRSNLVANLSVDLSSNFRIGTELRAQQRITDGLAIPPANASDGDAIRTVLFSVNSQHPHTNPWLIDEATGQRYLAGVPHIRRNDRQAGTHEEDIVGWTKDIRRDFVGSFWAEVTFPFGTTLRGTANLETDNREWDLARRSYQLYCRDAVANTYNVCYNANDRRREHLRSRGTGVFGNLTLSHRQQIGGHNFNGTLFTEANGGESGSTSLIGSSPTNYTHLIEQALVTEIDNGWNINRRASVGGRLDYDYNAKYLLTALARYDGSYLYAPGQRWGLFPGITAGWRITEEPFLRDRFGFLEDLKLRASWGQTGSETGGAWSYLEGATYGVGDGSVFDGTVITGVRPRGAPNLTLSWLTNTSKNIGLDALLFDGRVSIETDIFERVREGIAATRNDIQIPVEAAFPLPSENLNADATRGFEMAIRWNDQVGQVRYSVAPNFTIARSRAAVRYGERYGSQYDQYATTGNNTFRWNGAARGQKAIGQFQTVEQIESHPVIQDNNANRNLLPGDLIFEDANGDGIINGFDERTIGFDTDITPIVSYGAATSLSYKGLNLNVNWAGGAYFSHLRDFEMRYQGWSEHNGPAYGWDRWRRVDPYDPQSEWIPGRYPPLRVNVTGGSVPSYNTNTFWRTNVKFLRVRTMELSFDVPDVVPARVGLSGVRLFTNLSNPFSFDNTRHYMMDPEVSQVNGMVYPTIRMLQVGFRANVGGVQRPTVPVPTD